MISAEIQKTLNECIFLVEQGLAKFGSYPELVRKICHGHDNALLVARLERLAAERPGDMSLGPLLALKEQLITALR